MREVGGEDAVGEDGKMVRKREGMGKGRNKVRIGLR